MKEVCKSVKEEVSRGDRGGGRKNKIRYGLRFCWSNISWIDWLVRKVCDKFKFIMIFVGIRIQYISMEMCFVTEESYVTAGTY